jgi:hypothetical protein
VADNARSKQSPLNELTPREPEWCARWPWERNNAANVYTDTARGVHEAPTNAEIRGIVTRELPDNKLPVELKVIKGRQDVLNLEASTSSGYRADQRGICV